ncbi:MAG: AmmeMemoRadiSam system protein B [Proteobacteria bacterium]|nr:MAG: AmmeMemoRadiSam system protein B [Pseudomonadota bacterium]
MSNIRKSAFSGSFYPANKNEVLQYINHFNSNLNIEGSFNTKAIIVPHAGYIYSGFTANVAYNIAQSQKEKTIFVIGPSHRVYVQGASISLYDSYETPLGNIDVDKQFALHLKDKYAFLDFSPDAHESEHSTETQAPFIKHYFSNSRIIEIVYGKLDYKDLSSLLEEILEEDDFFVVISTDLSHFYTQEEANKIDNICLNAIAKKDMNLFDQGCEACGKIGVQAIIYCAIKKDLQTNLLHYCTSYDRTRDPSRVVGYVSALVGTA